ncbi:hypothetical protein IKF27_01725 [Candidatus Saccharibacteria bacterium]|nr:hypothetical protein [Candidatus Saccharibacteria bacterium]
MRIVELQKVPISRRGNLITHGVPLQSHELKTVLYLTEFGLDIELIRPSNIPHSNNPGLEMLGTIWEIKSPSNYNESTIKKRFRKSKNQSGGKSIFDLRNIQNNSNKAKKFILELFSSTREMRRIILIEKGGRVFDYLK